MKDIINRCVVCTMPLSGKQTQYCSTKCKNKVHQSYAAQKKRALERKLAFITALGGKCSRCGYEDNLAALSFHHKSGKEFKLDMRSLSNRDQESVEKEIAKCELLCSNCHMSLHNPSLDLAKLSIEPTALTTELRAHNTEIIANLASKFNQNLLHYQIRKSDRLVLGVSGGVDSTVMTELFYKAGYHDIIIAHLNHGIRKEATDDKKFVANLAKRMNYSFETKTIKKPLKGNLENELRKERREFLEEVAKRFDSKYIILGHNANDQAETVILNLVRGAGAAGLGGMSMSEDNIVRPLLNFSREEIESYAKENNIQWVEDITNRDITLKRNFVRHKILPLLEEINPEYLSGIYRSSYLMRKVDQHLNSEVNEFLGKKLETTKLRKLDKSLLYQVFISNYEKVAGTREEITLKHLMSLEELIQNEAGTKEIRLPNGIIARRKYRTLEFFPQKEDNIASNLVLKLGLGKHQFGKWHFEVTLAVKPEVSKAKNVLYLDESQFAGLSLRTWQPGDFIDKEGISGTKKLQDLFTDAKIDKGQRHIWPIMVNTKNEVLWVPELAISRKINTNSNKLIKIIARKGD